MSEKPRLYLDTNFFIAAMEREDAESDAAWAVLSRIRAEAATAITSHLTLAEVLVKPFELGQADLADAYRGMILSSHGLTAEAISLDILIMAARHRATRKIAKLPDAIHVATAQATGCQFYFTGDKRIVGDENLRPVRLDAAALEEALGVA